MSDTVVHVLPDRVLVASNRVCDANDAHVLEWSAAGTSDALPSVPAAASQTGRNSLSYPTVFERANTGTVPESRTLGRRSRTSAAPTNPVDLVSCRPHWAWGGALGANANGVFVSVLGNSATSPRRLGNIGHDLVRLTLERARGGEHAAGLVVELARAHRARRRGLIARVLGGAVLLLVADESGAWRVIVGDGRSHVERLPAGVHALEPTAGYHPGAILRRLDDGVDLGWRRRARLAALGGLATGPRGMMRALRDHGEGCDHPAYTASHGALGAPCAHAGGRVKSRQVVASWVSELAPDGARHWATATAAPCLSLFKPVRASEPVELGPPPRAVRDDESLWWRSERFHRLAARAPGHPRVVEAMRDAHALEIAWIRDDTSSVDAFAVADAWLEGARTNVAQAVPESRRPASVDRWWRGADRRAAPS